MTFAIITPALIVGAFAERMKFSAMLWFMTGWLTLVYLPVCHMTWSGPGGFFFDLGVLDFAGGIVVHITAGRRGARGRDRARRAARLARRTPMPPHNLTLTVAGTGMLWVGWFGFNAGSALGASGSAAMALVVTQISAATAALTWMAIEWLRAGRPSVLGIVTGSVAGLAAITPGVGLRRAGRRARHRRSRRAARATGRRSCSRRGSATTTRSTCSACTASAASSAPCSRALFASEIFGGLKGDLAIGRQLGIQLLAASLAALYAAAMTWAIAKAVDAPIGLRIAELGEEQGLDLHQHGESGYNL